VKSKARTLRRGGALIASGLCIFFVILIADAPASLAGSVLAAGGVGARYDSASGTLWKGRLNAVAWRGVRLGDIAFAFDPGAVLFGRVQTRMSIAGGPVIGKGRVSAGALGGYALRDVDAEIALDKLAGLRFLGAQASGVATVKVAALTGNSRGCRHAEGEVSTDAVASLATRFGRKGFALKGPIRCENGALVLPLSGGADGISVKAVLRFEGAGRVASKAEVATEDDQVALALQTLGFRNDNGVWRFETLLESAGGPT
jgi:hypothetical protein